MVTTISVGDKPTGVAINEKTNRIYVCSETDGKLIVIDGDTNMEIDTIIVGTTPESVAVNETTNRIYVTNKGTEDVTIIDGTTNTELFDSPIPLSGVPAGIEVNEETNRIYAPVVSGANSELAVIDGSNNTVILDIPLIPGPAISTHVAVNEKTNRIYVNNIFDKVFVINGNTNALDTTIVFPASTRPLGIEVNETTNRIYTTNVADTVNATLSTIDGETNGIIGSPIAIGGTLGFPTSDFAIDELNDILYVPIFNGKKVIVVDVNTNTVISPDIPFGNGPYAAVINKKTSIMYVINQTDDTLSIISVLTSPFTFGNEYHGLWEGKVNGNTREINATCGDAGLITGDVVKTLPIGSGTGFTPAGSLIPRVGIVTSSGESGYGVVTGGNKKGIYLNGFRPEPLIVEDSKDELLTIAGEENDAIRVCTEGICLARVINTTNTGLQPNTPLTPDFGGTTSIDNFGTLKPATSGDEVLARLLQTIPIGIPTDTKLRIAAVYITREGKLP